MRPAFALLFLLLASQGAGSARATESFDACTDFVTSLPATIATPGTWCLTRNLSTSAQDNVLDITADDVTLDCNGFRIDGTPRTQTVYAGGVMADGRQRITIRNCRVRGFTTCIGLGSPQDVDGHFLVEDNRLDRCGSQGILVSGDDSTVQRNQVLETANSTNGQGAFGISTYGGVDILDNLVSGVRSQNAVAGGLWTGSTQGSTVRGNLVRGVRRNGTTGAFYALLDSYGGTRMTIRGNTFIGEALPNSTGILCDSATSHAKDNTIMGFANPRVGCADDGNTIKP
jgi:hypothetical protein